MTHPETWLPHDGGPCPVSPETMVRVKFRSLAGAKNQPLVAAGALYWGHKARVGDIIAYQVPDPASPVGVEKGDAEGSETGPMRLINALRSAEGASVTINCDNPEFGGPNNAIEVCDDWTDWEPRRFKGDSLFKALLAAFDARSQSAIYMAGALSASPSPTPQPPVQEPEALVKGAHTPGPWALDGMYVIADPKASHPPSYTIVALVSEVTYQSVGTREANAALIASAPTLSSRVEELEKALGEAYERLAEIGDMAHHASTGPAAPDLYWDIRRIAYDAVAPAFDVSPSNGRAGE